MAQIRHGDITSIALVLTIPATTIRTGRWTVLNLFRDGGRDNLRDSYGAFHMNQVPSYTAVNPKPHTTGFQRGALHGPHDLELQEPLNLPGCLIRRFQVYGCLGFRV